MKKEKTMREKLEEIELQEPDFENMEEKRENFKREKVRYEAFLRRSSCLSDDALNRHFTI